MKNFFLSYGAVVVFTIITSLFSEYVFELDDFFQGYLAGGIFILVWKRKELFN